MAGDPGSGVETRIVNKHLKTSGAGPETITYPRSEHQQRVDELMRRAGQELPAQPTEPSPEIRILRAKLILEEAFETVAALGVVVGVELYDHFGNMVPLIDLDDEETGGIGGGAINFEHLTRWAAIRSDHPFPHMAFDMVEVADGCADVIVVTTGTLSACGLADERIQIVVDKNNLEKFAPGAECSTCNGSGRVDASLDPDIEGDEDGMIACMTCRGQGHLGGYRRKDGKWVKPVGFKGPDVAGEIERQRNL